MDHIQKQIDELRAFISKLEKKLENEKLTSKQRDRILDVILRKYDNIVYLELYSRKK